MVHEDRERLIDELVRTGKIGPKYRTLCEGLLRYLSLLDGEILMNDGRRLKPVEAAEEILRSQLTGSAADRFNALVEERAEKKKISYAAAFAEMQAEAPGLARDYANSLSYSAKSNAGRIAAEDASRQLSDEAGRIADAQGISFSEAFKKAMQERPDLARASIYYG